MHAFQKCELSCRHKISIANHLFQERPPTITAAMIVPLIPRTMRTITTTTTTNMYSGLGSSVGEGNVVGLDVGSSVGEGDVVGLDPGSTMGVGDVGANPGLSVWVATVV